MPSLSSLWGKIRPSQYVHVRLCACVHVCLYMCACVHVCTCACVHICICVLHVSDAVMLCVCDACITLTLRSYCGQLMGVKVSETPLGRVGSNTILWDTVYA